MQYSDWNNKFCKRLSHDVEKTFPCPKDSCSCGVFVLMHMSHHLGLLTVDPAGQNISTIRNAMAEELFLGVKEHPIHQNTEARATSKRCIITTRYKQLIGKTVVLYCSASEGVGGNFTWTHNGSTVSSEQEYKFELTEERTGTYCCQVKYDDGDTLMSVVLTPPLYSGGSN